MQTYLGITFKSGQLEADWNFLFREYNLCEAWKKFNRAPNFHMNCYELSRKFHKLR